MNTYLVLLLGINVGGKNKIPMSDLKTCLTDVGFSNVSTYIASGNVLLTSDKSAQAVQQTIERVLPKHFRLDSELIKVLVLTPAQLKTIIDKRPKGFGDKPDTYHSDVIFLMDVPIDKAMPVFTPRQGVDTIWPGIGVVYSQRLSAQRTKSRLGAIVGTSTYKSMTIRSWNTTTKLLQLLEAMERDT